MKNRLYLVSIFAAGGNVYGSNYSGEIRSISFYDKINFNQIRREFKETALLFINKGSVCIKETNIYTQTVVMENNKVIGYKTLRFSLPQILKWKNG